MICKSIVNYSKNTHVPFLNILMYIKMYVHFLNKVLSYPLIP